MTKTYTTKANATRAGNAALKKDTDAMGVEVMGEGKEWTFALVYPQPEADETPAESAEVWENHFVAASDKLSKCQKLRTCAAKWTGTRKQFIQLAGEHGVNRHTAATQWQQGRGA